MAWNAKLRGLAATPGRKRRQSVRTGVALCAASAGAGWTLAVGGAGAVGASEATPPRLVAASTVDRNGDGRIEAIRLSMSRPVRSTPARSASVLIWDGARRVVAVVGDAHGRRVTVSLPARWRPGSGMRPRIAYIPPGSAPRSRHPRQWVRAADGAAPVLTSATASTARGGGAIKAVNLRFSEAIRLRRGTGGAAIARLGGRRPLGRAAQAGRRTVRLRPDTRVADSSELTVLLRVRDPRLLHDAAGHPPRRAKMRVGAAKHVLPTTPSAQAGPPLVSSTRPIDPAYQTALEFGQRSHWLQPWRAYLDTVPASELLSAVGINFNVSAGEAPASARLLAASGVRRARIELPWSKLEYQDPTRLTDDAGVAKTLQALHDNGIRPLILLNANHGVPGPARPFDVTLSQAARAGDRVVHLTAATAAQIVPGLSGLDSFAEYKAAQYVFASVDSTGAATLSKPLDRDLAVGTYKATALRYAPFAPPFAADGSANPPFEVTLRGWLDYVRVVTQRVRAVLGSEDFDVEIWNELTFGSDFLDAGKYYDPAPQGSGSVRDEVLRRTVAWLRDPANGVPGVGVGDGFASTIPWPSGSTSPPGLTEIGKHPYHSMTRFPGDAAGNGGGQPLDALGRPEGVLVGNQWRDSFVPRYDTFFPEYYLTAIQTEHLIRDMSPLTTGVYGVSHGRLTHPPGAAPPTIRLTEFNMDPAGADPAKPANPDGTPRERLAPADVDRLQAKGALRSLSAYVNKGASGIDFYAAGGGSLGLIDPGFLEAVRAAPASYPGDDAGGVQMQALRRFTQAFAATGPPAHPRALSLLDVAGPADARQFDGDGTAAHPPLYDREVLGAFPFQASDARFVIPVYVMTRNIAELYRPDAPASDTTRYDLPPETFQLTIGGIRGTRARVSAFDPLTDTSVPVKAVARSDDTLVVQLPVTDSPRLLSIDDGG